MEQTQYDSPERNKSHSTEGRMLHTEASVGTLNQTKRRKNVPDLPQGVIA
jgi:hypothetical protein